MTSNKEIIEVGDKPEIEPKNSKSKSISLEIPKSEYITELKEMVSNKFKDPGTKKEFYIVLKKNGLETLEDWKKITNEEKKLYPHGLKHFLDEKASESAPLENVQFGEGKFIVHFKF